MTNATEAITKEWKRREDLVMNDAFRSDCARIAKDSGITAEEWNNNKAMICLMWANEICRLDNEN